MTNNAAEFCCVVLIGVASHACARAVNSVTLQPEQRTTLHVGEIASLRLPADGLFTVGSAGTSLESLREMRQQDTTIYLYRAITIGTQTLIATPGRPGPGGCISCVTQHYFIDVIR